MKKKKEEKKRMSNNPYSNKYPKEFIDLVTISFKEQKHGGQLAGWDRTPLIASIDGIEITVDFSDPINSQWKQREVALAGLYEAWKVKDEFNY